MDGFLESLDDEYGVVSRRFSGNDEPRPFAAAGTAAKVPFPACRFVKDAVFPEAAESNDFYQTERGKVASNDRRTTPASYAKFMNFYPFNDMDSISPRPILFVVGEVAPSRCYTDTAYAMAAEPKELVVIEGANRIDLYDRTEMIPWNKLTSFFELHLNK